MESLDYWRLCDELNVVQAALLVVSQDPSHAEYTEGHNVEKRPNGYEAAKRAIFDGLKNLAIKGTLILKPDYDQNDDNKGIVEDTIDPYKSVVNVESLKQWLRLKGFTSGFFFPEPIATMDFLDPLNTRYAPKLAAAVNAWQAVTDTGNKSPKQALDKWLREHAAEFGLTNDEGKPIETAIEECSKVANWNAKGGATKTPG